LPKSCKSFSPPKHRAAAGAQSGGRLERTLTVTRLGLHQDLLKTFASTNLIESAFSRAEELTRRVQTLAKHGDVPALERGRAALC